MRGIIYKPTRNVMQSGLGNTKKWILWLSKDISNIQENLMGYASTLDNINQVKISFASMKEAIGFAEANNIEYEIKENNLRRRDKKNYTFNFTKNINLYYY